MSCFTPMRFSAVIAGGVLASLLLAAAPSRAEVNKDGLFDMMEISSGNLDALPQWQRVMKSFPALKSAAGKCDLRIEDCSSQQMTLWRAKISELKHADKRIQMQEINRFLNDWKSTESPTEDNINGRWETPLEFLAKGGTSVDFAIMKYVSLKELGFSPLAMRIVITNDVLRNRPHAVLSVSLRGHRYVLDSLSDTALDEMQVKYYVPLYSVNEKRRWAHIPRDFLNVQTAQGGKADD